MCIVALCEAGPISCFRQHSNRRRGDERRKKITNAKPIPHIPLPFKEVMADVLKVKPPEKAAKPTIKKKHNSLDG
jgi:hypothetical protein